MGASAGSVKGPRRFVERGSGNPYSVTPSGGVCRAALGWLRASGARHIGRLLGLEGLSR